MKHFDKRVRFFFRVCIDGYGHNTKEAFLSALKRAETAVEDGSFTDTWQTIENHEMDHIDETDIAGDDEE